MAKKESTIFMRMRADEYILSNKDKETIDPQDMLLYTAQLYCTNLKRCKPSKYQTML